MSKEDLIKERLQADMKSAMRTQDKERLSIIRFVLAAIKRQEIDQRTELTDQQVLEVLEKLVKQHQDSISQYEHAGRKELAEKERFELSVVETYMPKSLSNLEIDSLVQEAISSAKATSIRDMGKVIQYIKTHAKGRIDMQVVSQKVKTQLS
ncbi:MAG: GatB/YqeY domain-containing protein [Gammaproteobacteria bacterium]|nr:GatB/YqeY domain-containing protein [Gammaproteobacteria bacterium]